MFRKIRITLDSLIRSNIYLYILVRKSAVFLCRYFLLEDGFSFLRQVEFQKNSVVADVGSNDGTSIEMILQLIPNTKIYAFDPIREPKSIRDHIIFQRVALSDNKKKLKIFTPWYKSFHLSQYSSSDEEKVKTQLKNEFNISPEQLIFEEIDTETITLDSLDLVPSLIKIDVEGHELKVLLGSLSTIEKSLPIILVEIQSEVVYNDIQSLLRDLGYFHLDWPQHFHTYQSLRRGKYTKSRNNYLFVHGHSSSTWWLKE